MGGGGFRCVLQEAVGELGRWLMVGYSERKIIFVVAN